jgi:hypothetical protein
LWPAPSRSGCTGQAGESADALRFCLRKLGYLDPDAADYRDQRRLRRALTARYRTLEALAAATTDPDASKALRAYGRARYLFTGLDGCGVRWWSSCPTTETAGYNALVQGGRCHNERPVEYATGPGLDVDISGCYGAALRKMVYPVGLPRVWSYQPNEARPTLEKWLNHNGQQLVDGLWTCTVSGPLPFEQDLVYSKLVKAADLRKAADGKDIPSEFALLRREIRNGIITADVLAALRAAATNEEWAAIRRLEVVTACAYLAKDRRADVGEWCREVLAAPSEDARARVNAGTAEDRRTRAWYGVPLEDFVGRLADERERCKQREREVASPQERQQWKGRDAVLKLLVNTLYGTAASRHFALGNVVVANNITARARVAVWMVAKALGLRQSITDGGIYTPSSVPVYSDKKPGLATLSRPWAWDDRRHGRTHAPMGGREWPAGVLPDDADAVALEQVRQFWSPYHLEFPFALSHKGDNTFVAAAYWSKADYALLTEKEKAPVVYKLRGKSRSKRDDRKPHPAYALLDNILAGKDAFPRDLGYTRRGILKVGLYLIAQASQGGYADLKGLRPGDNMPHQGYDARYNNVHMPLDDEATYQRRRRRKKVHRGRPVQWFERYQAGGIAAAHRAMVNDNLRLPGAPPSHPSPRKRVGTGANKDVTR